MTVTKHLTMTVKTGVTPAEILPEVAKVRDGYELIAVELDDELAWQKKTVTFTFRREVTDE